MRLAVVDTERCTGCQCCMFACVRRLGEAGLAESSIFISSAGGMAKGFKVIVCRACEDPPCARVCPTGAIKVRDEGGVRVAIHECIGCGNCREACILRSVFWNDETEKPVICIHCGYCVDFCPHGVLAVEGGKGGEEHAARK